MPLRLEGLLGSGRDGLLPFLKVLGEELLRFSILDSVPPKNTGEETFPIDRILLAVAIRVIPPEGAPERTFGFVRPEFRQ